MIFMSNTMKTIAMLRSLPISDPEALIEAEMPIPVPGAQDLLVRVKAVSINPVDVKVRTGAGVQQDPKILGWDAAGIVESVGENVSGFVPGDEVYYAGDLTRPGSNAEYQTVDYRIVAKKPASLGFTEAAAIPLTAITAWETLFDHMGLTKDTSGNLLVIGGAGGVGSMVIQLAKARTSLRVIASASRRESVEWCKKLGADDIVDHSKDLGQQVQDLGGADYVFSAYTEHREEDIASAMNPQSQLVFIDDPQTFNIGAFKPKSISVTPEFMFTRSMFATEDMAYQSDLLRQVADMIDSGQITGTLTETLTGLSVESFREGHQKVESSHMIGKLVISYS